MSKSKNEQLDLAGLRLGLRKLFGVDIPEAELKQMTVAQISWRIKNGIKK